MTKKRAIFQNQVIVQKGEKRGNGKMGMRKRK
jgi:hypothetical protein